MKKSTAIWFAAVVLLTVAPLAKADEENATAEPARPVAVETGHTHEWLTNNYGHWLDTWLSAKQRQKNDVDVYGTVRSAERYGMTDQETALGFAIPLGTRDNILAEASSSNSHQVLPIWSGMMEVDHQLAGQWAVDITLKRTEYDAARLTMGGIRLEKYLGDWYARYTWQPVVVDGLGNASSNIFQLRRYYGDRDYVGAGYAVGREIEGAGPFGTVFSDVQDVSIVGRHALVRTWLLGWEAGTHNQGTYYTRNWLGLSLNAQF